MNHLLNRFTATFPLWAILLALVAYLVPGFFIDMKPAIIPLLVLIMFAMGMTLNIDDFKRVLLNPKVILLGVLIQYSIMPLAAWLISLILGLPAELMLGMVLVGSSAGGTASNVICFLARGDVALSISMTLCSTLLAIVAMPFLTWLYVGQSVPVPVMNMLLSILKIVLIPVLLGVSLNTLFGHKVKKLAPVFPFVASLSIVIIIAIIVALNHGKLATVGATVVTAVVLHNLIGLLSGYQLARWMGYSSRICRTLAIEVGMQNSGLSVALALKHFTVAAALPGALFSIWHNLSGAILAATWTRQDRGKT